MVAGIKMSDLQIPDSWASSKLGEIVDRVQYGATASAKKSGKLKLLRITDITDEGVNWDTVPFCDLPFAEGEKYLLQNGDVLIARTGGTVGKSFRVVNPPKNVIFASYLIRLCPKPEFRQTKYIEMYLRSPSYWSAIQQGAKGAAQPNVNSETLKAISLPLPPLQEQIRVVAKIESTQEKIKTIEESVSKAEELIGKYRESLLQKAFRGQLVPQDPNDEPASELLKRIRAKRAQATDSKKKKKEDLPLISEDEIPFEIPKSWEWVRIGELFQLEIILEHKDGNHGSNYPRSAEFVSSGVPFLTAKSITSDEQISENLLDYLSPKKAKSLSIGHIKKGDVLFAHNATVGPVVEYNFDFDDAVIGTSLTCYRPNPRYLTQSFLAYALRSWIFQSQIRKVMGQATRNQVPITKQREMILPLPPLQEQKRIAKLIDELIPGIGSATNRIQRIAHVADLLRHSMLNSAFSGNLVPQISSEGTGQELLKMVNQLSQKNISQKSGKPSKKKAKL